MTRLACGFRVTFLKLSVDASRSRGLEQGAKLSSPWMIHIIPTAVVHSGATPIAEIVDKIIGKILPSYPWSGEAKSLSRDLKNLSLEELLRVSSVTGVFAVMANQRE